MSPRRNRFEIWSEVLEACLRDSKTQSYLIRKVGVKTSTVKDALDVLEESGLIEKVENLEAGLNYEFRTTVKGENALLQYYKLVTEYFTTGEKEHTKEMLGLLRFITRKKRGLSS
jgi:predicted transcriptional regulator